MGRAHDFEMILKAAELLKNEKEIIFLFIGGGKQREAVESECGRRGIGSAVFKPFQPYDLLNQSLNVADAHLISLRPSLEGLIVPSKFYGILAAGRPVLNLGNPAGEIGRWIERIGCGHSFSEENASGLAGTVLELSRDRDRTAFLGSAGRRYFETHFDRRIAAGFWKSLLDEAGKS